MNLFANEIERLLQNIMTEDWAKVLADYLSVEQLEIIQNKVRGARFKGIVYPDKEDTFKAFNFPYNNIKCVIIGQDPYFNGNADGLAFSCKMNLSPSLKQIFNARNKDLNQYDCEYDFKRPYSLEEWAKQGVFLFNPTLTVETKNPNSHKYIWKDFSKAIIRALLWNKESLVWLVWGNSAKESLQEVNPKFDSGHLILYNEHPASAARNNRAWKCDHFSKCNNYLKGKGMEEIKWLQ